MWLVPVFLKNTCTFWGFLVLMPVVNCLSLWATLYKGGKICLKQRLWIKKWVKIHKCNCLGSSAFWGSESQTGFEFSKKFIHNGSNKYPPKRSSTLECLKSQADGVVNFSVPVRCCHQCSQFLCVLLFTWLGLIVPRTWGVTYGYLTQHWSNAARGLWSNITEL